MTRTSSDGPRLRAGIALLAAVLQAGCVFYDVGSVALRDASRDPTSDLARDMDAQITPDAPDGADAADQGCGDNCCEPEIDLQFCARLVLNCGVVTGDDNCGNSRNVDCGVCTAPATCGGGGTANVCACPAQTDEEFCALLVECGPVTSFDACGQMRTVDCGTCPAPETCGGAGAPGVCGCAAESDVVFCSRQDACGLLTGSDNCGAARSADCGGCPVGETCSATNACACEPENDADFCTRLNACEVVMAVDNCNAQRTVDCGMCAGALACTNNQCDCTPEDDATFCTRLGSECDALQASDNCATPRTVASCGTCAASALCASNVCVEFPPPDLAVWLRSDTGVDAQGGNALVLSWTDPTSGSAWNSTVGVRPYLAPNAIGGFPAVRFSGGQYLRANASDTLTTTQFTTFVVGRRATTVFEGPIFGVSPTLPGDHELAFGTTPSTMRFQSDSGLAFAATVLDTSTAQVLTFRADGATFEFYQNATLSASSAHVPAGPFEFNQLGDFREVRGLRGDIAEVLFWPRALSDPEREVVLAYLMGRYGF